MEMNFDATQYELLGASGFLFPLGIYPITITGAVKKANKNSNGSHLEITFMVNDGEFTGKVQRTAINLWNESSEAVERANRALATICCAVGIHHLSNANQLLDQRLAAELGPQDNNPKYSEVKRYFMEDGSDIERPVPSSQPQRKALPPALQRLATEAIPEADAIETKPVEKKKAPWVRN